MKSLLAEKTSGNFREDFFLCVCVCVGKRWKYKVGFNAYI